MIAENGKDLNLGRNQMNAPADVCGMDDPALPRAEQTVCVASGLNASDRDFVNVKISAVSAFLKTRKECYERTMPTEAEPNRVLNRLYIDLDGELPFETLEQDFDTKNALVIKSLKTFCEAEGYAMMEASKWKCPDDKGNVTNKLSFRLNHPRLCGKKDAIKHLVEHKVAKALASALKGIIEVKTIVAKKRKEVYEGFLIIDLSVYNPGNRKMRMLHQTKPLQNRPNKLVMGTDEDMLITYIPSDCKRLPEPVSIFTAPEPKEKEPKEPQLDEASERGTVITGDPTEDELASKQLVADVVENLGQHRWDYYPDWVHIGFILYNEGFTVDEYIEFSKRSKHWKASTSPQWVKDKWKGFKRSNLTQARLWKWLSEDDIDVYGELATKRRDFWNLVKNHNHAETARYFFNLKPDSYAFNERLGWFQIQPSNIWKHYEKQPSGLLSDIWYSFRKVIVEHEKQIDLKSTDEAQMAIMKSRFKALASFNGCIGNKSFCDGVIAFLPSMYNDDELDKKMDEQRHLIAFTDKVYDLDKREPRPIKPEDYICINTGYAYPQKVCEKAMTEVVSTMRSLFETDEEVRLLPHMSAMTCYVLKTLASCLHGTKKFEKFYVWTGSGGNGKGLVSELIKRAFGDYYHSIPHSCLTKVQDKKDAPNPPIAKAKGKRFVQASEPEAEDKLQAGVVKEMSGGDEITARDMYRSTVTYRPQFGLFLQTNAIPKLNRADGGVQRRMEVAEFPFKFVRNPTDPSHKKINEDLKDKIIKSPEWRDAMFHLLLEAYGQILEEGIDAPACVLASSEEYMDENNPIKEWLINNYHLDKDSENRKYSIGSNNLRLEYQADTNHTISPDKFKQCMMLCGVTQKKFGHPFKADGVDYPAGKYWCGLEKKDAM